jgi:hypothetical protein
VATTNGGSSWFLQQLPNELHGAGVSCPNTLMCVTAGQDGTPTSLDVAETATSSNGGDSWTPTYQFGETSASNAVSCRQPRACVVVGTLGIGSHVEVSVDGGNTWRPQTIPDSSTDLIAPLLGVSCPTKMDCIAVGQGTIAATTDGGVQWFGQTFPTQVQDLYGVSCPTAKTCWAVGTTTSGTAAIIGTTNGGGTWSSQPVPSGLARLNGVSCVSAADCWAVGGTTAGTGVVVTTSATPSTP